MSTTAMATTMTIPMILSMDSSDTLVNAAPAIRGGHPLTMQENDLFQAQRTPVEFCWRFPDS
jgi:hypothetical protein